MIEVNNILDQRSSIADCLITKERCKSLWIYTADCIPILIADLETGNISACHVGLRGLKKYIISKTLKRLEKIGSKKSNLIIALGPSIQCNKYQLSIRDVDDLLIKLAGEVCMKRNYYYIDFRKGIIPLFKKKKESDRLHIDIQDVAVLQLYKEGIKQSQINLNRLCTYSNPKIFNSYRRNNTKLRQWSCIYS